MTLDEIIEMIDASQSMKVQRKGLELARKVKNFQVFFPLFNTNVRESVEDNCALVISEKSDAELECFLPVLFEWICYFDKAGSVEIFERLKKMEKTDTFLNELEKAKKIAKEEGYIYWFRHLELLGGYNE